MTYDHLIIGSGLIGITSAIALAQKTREPIAITDVRSLELMQEEETNLDTRTLALSAASIDYLKQLDLWNALLPLACPIQQVHISEQGAFGSSRLNCKDIGEEALGYVVEIKDLQKILLGALKHHSHITIFNRCAVSKLKYDDQHWEISTPKETLLAKNIILADGTQSQLRDALDISCDIVDFHQTAIVAVVECTLPHQNTAYERFASEEILAVLPLTKNRIGTVLVTRQTNAEKLLQLTEREYLSHLQKIMGARLGKFTQLGKKQTYPLREVIAKKFSLDHLVLLGNTAHTLNPIGAQGLNLGLAGVKSYIENPSQFEKLQRQRCEHLSQFTQQVDRVFRSEDSLTKVGRRFALLALEHSLQMKKRFIRQMMGR